MRLKPANPKDQASIEPSEWLEHVWSSTALQDTNNRIGPLDGLDF